MYARAIIVFVIVFQIFYTIVLHSPVLSLVDRIDECFAPILMIYVLLVASLVETTHCLFSLPTVFNNLLTASIYK